MQGLRTQEGWKFEKYFQMVQAEAKKQNSVFFLDCGEGHELIRDDIECEDLCGWLIPFHKVKEFEELYSKHDKIIEQSDDWIKYTRFAEWEQNNKKIIVKIVNYGIFETD